MKTVVGKILKPQGLQGEMKIKPLLSDAENFYNFQVIFIDKQEYNIRKVRVHNGFVYLAVDQVQNCEQVEELRDKMVSVDKKDLPELNEGEYYITDLEGCDIYFETGEKAGSVVEVNNYGASDVLTIMDGTEEILCPFLSDVFVEVDLSKGKIIADKKRFLDTTKND